MTQALACLHEIETAVPLLIYETNVLLLTAINTNIIELTAIFVLLRFLLLAASKKLLTRLTP